jgi:hypothetical protein
MIAQNPTRRKDLQPITNSAKGKELQGLRSLTARDIVQVVAAVLSVLAAVIKAFW